MNMNENPTLDQLTALFALADDNAGDHLLWVDAAGSVHLTLVTQGDSLAATAGNVRLRYSPTYPRGEGWVGPDGAGDHECMQDHFGSLLHQWQIQRDKRPGELSVCVIPLEMDDE